MTDDKLNNISKAIGFALAVMLFVLIAIGWAFGQEKGVDVTPKCTHASIVERWQQVRVASPYTTKVTYFDGRHLEAISQDRLTTQYIALETDKETVLPKRFDKDYKGKKVLLVWCSVHNLLYEVSYPTKDGK